MLTDEERREIMDAARAYPSSAAAVSDALLAISDRHGWVSDEQVQEVASLLGVSAAEVESIATFYTRIYRKPVGRHVILICDSVSCWIMGYPSLREHLTTRLGINFGETTPDGRFTLLPTVCLGHCDHAPAMMVGNDLHGDLTPATIDEILERYV